MRRLDFVANPISTAVFTLLDEALAYAGEIAPHWAAHSWATTRISGRETPRIINNITDQCSFGHWWKFALCAVSLKTAMFTFGKIEIPYHYRSDVYGATERHVFWGRFLWNGVKVNARYWISSVGIEAVFPCRFQHLLVKRCWLNVFLAVYCQLHKWRLRGCHIEQYRRTYSHCFMNNPVLTCEIRAANDGRQNKPCRHSFEHAGETIPVGKWTEPSSSNFNGRLSPTTRWAFPCWAVRGGSCWQQVIPRFP